MRNLINKILNLFHWHYFSKPIVSQYVSFHTRNIVFECKCGKRCARKVSRLFSESFPIETSTHLTDREFNLILNGKSVKEVRGY